MITRLPEHIADTMPVASARPGSGRRACGEKGRVGYDARQQDDIGTGRVEAHRPR